MCGLTALAVAGVALSAAGTVASVSAASGQAQAQQQMIAAQQGIEAQRKQQMELEAKRRRLEMIRQMQRARSQALTSATNQGAIFGSGLQGGYGQISGQTGTNMLGLSQNLEIGRNIFGLNQQVSAARMSSAQYGAMGALGSGLSSFGGSLVNNSLALNRLTTPPTPYASSMSNPYNFSYGSDSDRAIY